MSSVTPFNVDTAPEAVESVKQAALGDRLSGLRNLFGLFQQIQPLIPVITEILPQVRAIMACMDGLSTVQQDRMIAALVVDPAEREKFSAALRAPVPGDEPPMAQPIDI